MEVVIAASTRISGQLAQRDFFLDEVTDNKSIDASDGTGFRRGEHARQDAADNDERRQQSGPSRADRTPQRA
jgi:hypothetical protein